MADTVEGDATGQEARVAGDAEQSLQSTEQRAGLMCGAFVGGQFVTQQRPWQDLGGTEGTILHARSPAGGIGEFASDLVGGWQPGETGSIPPVVVEHLVLHMHEVAPEGLVDRVNQRGRYRRRCSVHGFIHVHPSRLRRGARFGADDCLDVTRL